MRYGMFLAPVFAIVCSLPSARAGDYVNPEGFRLTYPEGWKTASKEQLDKIVEMARKPAEPDVGIVGCILGPRGEGFTPFINLIVLKSPLVLDSAHEDQMVNGIKGAFTAHGATAPDFKTTHFQIDGHKLFSVAYEEDDSTHKTSLRVWMVLLPTKSGTCLMKCVAPKSQWAEAGPVFKSIINSLKFDGVPAN